jgi:hypothetical protein
VSYLASKRTLLLKRTLILASIFAAAVVVLFISGAGPGAVLNFLLFVAGPLAALFFTVRSAVSAGGRCRARRRGRGGCRARA